MNDEIQVDGYTLKSREDAVVYFNRVSPRYFETLGTPLLAGAISMRMTLWHPCASRLSMRPSPRTSFKA